MTGHLASAHQVLLNSRVVLVSVDRTRSVWKLRVRRTEGARTSQPPLAARVAFLEIRSAARHARRFR
jgi:hypothetical protein